MLHQVKLRVSPGGTRFFPYRYGQTNIILRFYLTLGHGPVTLGLRLVGDAQFGHPPF